MEKIHLHNAKRLQEIIVEIGWPSRNKVGDQGSQAAWLIVQHAISWPSFMKSCLTLMSDQLEQSAIDTVHIAYLSDRIAMYEDRPQSYSTQFIIGPQDQLVFYQLDAPVGQINQRRQQLGLSSIEEKLAELIDQSKHDAPAKPSEKEKHLRQEIYNNWRQKVGWIE